MALEINIFQQKLQNSSETEIFYQIFLEYKWGCSYTGFIDFMLERKTLLDYTNLFSPDDWLWEEW